MQIPPAIKDYIDEAIARSAPDTSRIAADAAQAAEAAISHGLASILNARTAEMRQHTDQSIADLRLELAKPAHNPQQLAAEVAQIVEASISAGIANIINQRTAQFRQELDDVLAQVREETAKTEVSADRLLAAVADLEARVRKWLDSDRYSITRAHVIKAMRGKNNG